MALEAEATHLPSGIEVSIDGLEIGTQVTAGDLTLPAGSTLAVDAEHVLLIIAEAPTAEEVEAEMEAAAEELGIVEEPTDAAQAAAAEAAAAEGTEGRRGAEGEGATQAG